MGEDASTIQQRAGAVRQRFELSYQRGRAPLMLDIECASCGSDHGGTSWATASEAEALVGLLGLGPESNLLEVGCGSGWPGLFLATESGCRLAMIDLPEVALGIAAERAGREGIAARTTIALADAAVLPFADGEFDAVNHSDVLCCLPGKLGVLRECRRVTKFGGRMVFSVIEIADGLSMKDRARAIKTGPEFIEAEADYPGLLSAAGWSVVEIMDLTREFAETHHRRLVAESERRAELEAFFGPKVHAERLAGIELRMAAIDDELLSRRLYVARPDSSLQ